MRLAIVVMAVMLFSACSILVPAGSGAPVGVPAPPVEPNVHRGEPAPVPSPQPGRSAYEQLLQKADNAGRQGSYRQAMALLERAQRIQPHNGHIYWKMALVAEQMGDYANAQAIAMRGLLYCDTSALCAKLRALSR